MMNELLLKDEVYAIVGAAMDVHTELGPGFLEAVYHEALALEFALRDIPYQSETPLDVQYKGQTLQKQYVADLVCYREVIVELKAVRALSRADEAQLLNYLKITGLRVGVLINFGSDGQLEWKRLVR